MKSKLVAGMALASMLLPVFASAASISGAGTAIFSNQTNLYGNAGNTVQVSTNFDVPAGQVLHAIETDQVGDFVGPVCHPVSIVEGNQTNVPVAFSEVLSPNANDYGFTMKAFTAATVPQANALNAILGTACTGTNTTVYNQGNVVHVLPGAGTGSGGSNVGNSSLDALMAQIASLTAQLGCWSSGGTWTANACVPKPVSPPKPAGCDAVVAFNGSNAWQAQASLFGVSAGAAVFYENGVNAPTGNFKSISAKAALAVAAVCK